jgi:hypothetical protein
VEIGDLRAVIRAYHRCVASVIEPSGGFVAKDLGEGVLAYFGYPRTDEHDAGRAVRRPSCSARRYGCPFHFKTPRYIFSLARLGMAKGYEPRNSCPGGECAGA